MSSDPTYPLYSVFAFLGFILGLVPLPWHLQAWNAGTCVYMLWASLSCLISFVNSIVWNNNVENIAPVWCDISSKFLIGAGVGIPAASLCISRRLYSIAAIQVASVTKRDKRHAVYWDLSIAIGIPIMVMILHYIVQGHRFDILEDIGCYPATYNTLAAYFLVSMWPILLGCISFVYSALTLRAFWQRRIQFSEFLSSNSSMNISRYLRLMLLASIEMICTIPLGIYSIYIASYGVELSPWVSWASVHFNFSRVDLIPALLWRSNPSFLVSVELSRWLFPICSLLFFALFGFAGEAQKHYRATFWFVARKFGFNPSATQVTHFGTKSWKASTKPNKLDSTVGTLPVYISHNPVSKDQSSSSLASSFARSDIDMEKAEVNMPYLPQYDPPSTIYPETQFCVHPSEAENSPYESAEIRQHIFVSDAYSFSRQPSPSFPEHITDPARS